MWWNSPFELCGFGIPSVILNDMCEGLQGVFKPQMSERRSKRARIKHNIFAKEAQQQEKSLQLSGLGED